MNYVLFICPFTAFRLPLSLVTSLIFLVGGMGARKIQKTLHFARCCEYSGKGWTKADCDIARVGLDAEELREDAPR